MAMSNQCRYCGLQDGDQHSNRRGGWCDGIRDGVLRVSGNDVIRVKDGVLIGRFFRDSIRRVEGR